MAQFGSLFLGNSAIQANQAALRIIGNNIANVATPGFIREEIDLSPIKPDRFGGLTFGNGVTISGVRQKVDLFLLGRAREAAGEFAAASARAKFLSRAEFILGELTDTDVSTGLNEFFASLQDVANRPDDAAVRSIVVSRATILTDDIRRNIEQIDNIRNDISREVNLAVDQINQSIETIRQLNVEIVASEVSLPGSDAGGLRVLRNQELDKVSDLIDIHVREDDDGAVNVYTDAGSIPILFEGHIEKIGTIVEPSAGLLVPKLTVLGSQIPLSGGRLGGAQQARDQDLAALSDSLNTFASNLIFEFNKLHSSGQGLKNHTLITGSNHFDDPTVNLDDANGDGKSDAVLPFIPNNGSFELKTTDLGTGLVTTTVIGVNLNGTATGDSINTIIAAINAAGVGVTASLVATQRIRLRAAANIEFSFANDTSGFLAAAGLNTFFSGSDARTIGVDDTVRQDPALLAASQNGSPGDVSNALLMANFQDQTLSSLQGFSVTSFFGGIIEDLGALTQTALVRATASQNTKLALESESLSITGVNLDEEAVKLIAFQRAFQASARFISTINEMLDELINLGR